MDTKVYIFGEGPLLSDRTPFAKEEDLERDLNGLLRNAGMVIWDLCDEHSGPRWNIDLLLFDGADVEAWVGRLAAFLRQWGVLDRRVSFTIVRGDEDSPRWEHRRVELAADQESTAGGVAMSESQQPRRGSFRIETMTPADLERALDWAAAEGSNPGLHDAGCFYAADPGGFFVGVRDGEPVGSISCVAYDHSFGFLGLYVVRPEFRGKGDGMRLWRAAMSYLEQRTVGLNAVIEQQENYRKSGFEPAHRNVRYRGTGGGEQVKGVTALSNVRLPDVVGYDRQMFPAHRVEFLARWIAQPGGTALGVVRGKMLASYGVLRPCREGFKVGPLFADVEAAAEALFASLLAQAPGAPVFLDVPAVNPAAVALALRHGMEPVFESARMYRGKAPKLPLERIYGVTTLELG